MSITGVPMQSHYTQILARTDRSTQALGALKDLDAYRFASTSAGTLICERTSEALDVRITIQVAEGISSKLGRGHAVLAIVGTDDNGFWCGLFDGGELRFEQNRLTGPREITEKPASPSEVGKLCGSLGVSASAEEVHAILTGLQYGTALERHAALAQALELPRWSPGLGYSRIVDGSVPAEAGAATRPPGSLKDLRPFAESLDDIDMSDSKRWFQDGCQRAFGFLEELGFRKEPAEPEPQNSYTIFYRGLDLIVVIEGLSYGGRTRLCLIDQGGYLLDLAKLVERRDPELLDLCQLADGQREEIPIFAEALRKCAADVLAGDLSEISRLEGFEPGFSFGAFSSQAEADAFLARHGPHLLACFREMRQG